MIKVIAHFYIKPELIEKTDVLFKELVEKSRLEEGCISYELFEAEGDASHFVFIETWKDKAILDAHGRTEHFTRIIKKLQEMSYKNPLIAILNQKF